jgi:uncharacterized peroxidase-related enzyme
MSDRAPSEPRIARVDPAAADAPLRGSFDHFMQTRGKVPNLFRITAHRPDIGRTLADHLDAVMGAGEVDQQLKELIAVRVSQLNGCDYCLASHTTLAKRLGATQAQIDAVGAGDLSDFAARWQAPLAVAAAMTADRGRVDDALYARLDADWTPAQIIEILSVIGAFNYFNRFANALCIPPTR